MVGRSNSFPFGFRPIFRCELAVRFREPTTRGELVSGSLVQEFFLLLFLQVGGPILVDLNGKFGKFAQPNPGGKEKHTAGYRGRKKGGRLGRFQPTQWRNWFSIDLFQIWIPNLVVFFWLNEDGVLISCDFIDMLIILIHLTGDTNVFLYRLQLCLSANAATSTAKHEPIFHLRSKNVFSHHFVSNFPIKDISV